MINKVILVGNVGLDPEVRTTETGVKVARVRLATTERVYDRQANESKEYTEWHTVTLWRGLADVVDRFVHKGSQLYIEGSLRTREWTDRETNQKRYATEIVASEMKLLGRRSENGGGQQPSGGYSQPSGQNNYGGGYSAPQQSYQQAPAPQPQAPVAAPAEDPDDLPF